jgi:hypothetical protein
VGAVTGVAAGITGAAAIAGLIGSVPGIRPGMFTLLNRLEELAIEGSEAARKAPPGIPGMAPSPVKSLTFQLLLLLLRMP